MAEAAQDRLRIVDPATNPYLSGRYAPVARETDADDLQVEGTLPADIDGVFMRNGPNPKFPPLGSYSYPLEGDGMIHAVWIGQGKARYRNRWVWTNGLRAEERAGRALYGGIMTRRSLTRGCLGPTRIPAGRSSWTRSSISSATQTATSRWRKAPRRMRSARNWRRSAGSTSAAGCRWGCAHTRASIPAPARWWCSATTFPSRS